MGREVFARTRPSGLASRAARLGAATGLCAPVAVGLGVAGLQAGTPISAALFLCAASAGVLALLIWLWFRLPLSGVAFSSTGLRVRGWFSTRYFDRGDVRKVGYRDYEGFFYIVGWPVAAGSMQSGVLTIVAVDSEAEVTLAGTLANYRVARQQAEFLNRWLGVSVGAGTGPRRKAQRNIE